jgi:hypothetical protein
MNPGPVDNNADGQSDNVGLNNAEINDVRSSAMLVPGLEQDPPGKFLTGNAVATRIPDRIGDAKVSIPYLDIASLRVAVDLAKGETWFSIQLAGFFPQRGARSRYWLLLDLDGPETGANPSVLRTIGAPDLSFKGIDVAIELLVQGKKASGKVWKLKGDDLVPVETGARFDLQALVMHPHYATLERTKGYPVHHVVAVALTKGIAPIALGKPFRAYVISVDVTGEPVDALDPKKEGGQGAEFVVDYPSFPHCYPDGPVAPGGQLKVTLEKLRPRAPIHAFLGPRLIFKGETDEKSGGSIEVQIPNDTIPGLHLLTVGIERTALTADCAIQVTGGKDRPTR